MPARARVPRAGRPRGRATCPVPWPPDLRAPVTSPLPPAVTSPLRGLGTPGLRGSSTSRLRGRGPSASAQLKRHVRARFLRSDC
jgi:hypothetical protein